MCIFGYYPERYVQCFPKNFNSLIIISEILETNNGSYCMGNAETQQKWYSSVRLQAFKIFQFFWKKWKNHKKRNSDVFHELYCFFQYFKISMLDTYISTCFFFHLFIFKILHYLVIFCFEKMWPENCVTIQNLVVLCLILHGIFSMNYFVQNFQYLENKQKDCVKTRLYVFFKYFQIPVVGNFVG